MAQLIGCRSITAAAEDLVTFRFCSSWWKARLLACLGSSAAQGDAGGPGAPPLRTSSASLRSAPVPIPSGLRPSPLDKGSRPLKGKAYGRPQGPPLRREPNRDRWLGKVRRSRGTAAAAIFATQGPVARKKSQKATQILRAGNILPDPRGNPVMGVRGKAGIGERSSPLRRPPAILWVLSHLGKLPRPAGRNPVKLPAARRGRGPGQPLLPLRDNSPSRALRRRQNLRGGGGKPPPYRMRLVKAEQISAPHPPPPWAPDPILSGLRPSPLEKGSRPPGGRPNESGRRNTPLRINDHTNIRFKYFPV